MGTKTSPWMRIGLAALAAPHLATGAWAVLAPHNWFTQFPGADPRLVAAEPPFNQHLATDAGAGFLATGVALALAVMWPARGHILIALAAFVAFAFPHFLYHTFNPAPGLSASEDVTNAVTLGASLVLASALGIAAVARPHRQPQQNGASGRESSAPASLP